MVLLFGVTLLTLVPFRIPRIESLRRGILNLVRLRFADAYVFSNEWVDASAVEQAVGNLIVAELEQCRSLTVVAYSQGTVVSYEVLAELGRPVAQAALVSPYVSVAQALADLGRPLPREGLPVTFITVGAALNRTLGWRQRRMLSTPLPPGTRWVDIWSVHDPVPMGSLDRGLLAASGLAPSEVRVSNTLTPLNAHTTYWSNTPEVVATIAEELITAGAVRRLSDEPGGPPAEWSSRTPGLWAWRTEHGRSDRACALRRRGRIVYWLAFLRAAGYIAVMAAAVLGFLRPGEYSPLVASAGAALVVSILYLVVFVTIEALAMAFARWWWDRPCPHTLRNTA
jgi:hypothetical protein